MTVSPEQPLTPEQAESKRLYDLTLTYLASEVQPVMRQVLPNGDGVGSLRTKTGVDVRYCFPMISDEKQRKANEKRFLLKIVGPSVPKLNSQNTSQIVVHWEKPSPENGVVELRETTESGDYTEQPVVFPETKIELIGALILLLDQDTATVPPIGGSL